MSEHIELRRLGIQFPHVTEKEDLSGLDIGDGLLGLIAHDVVDVLHLTVEVPSKPLRVLFQRDEIPLSLPALMCQYDYLGLLSHQFADRGDDASDPRIVDDLQCLLVQGTVDVHPQKDGLVLEIEILERVEVLHLRYLQMPIALLVFSIDLRGSSSSLHMDLIQSMFSGMTSLSWLTAW